ncbi:MAG: hypothetical protein BroJett018_33790 [Chloroflexota bacterium]|nr:MAG: hypothetical protein BroJett018_33790 [Chloroflexota bacterium]
MAQIIEQIIERVNQLDSEHQKKVLEFLTQMQTEVFDIDQWFQEIEEIHDDMRSERPILFGLNVQQLLDEVREERLSDFTTR